MKIEVLLSCMHQKDTSIVQRSNLQKVPTVVVNQCETAQEQVLHPTPNLTWIDTPTRGLSVSRNLAIVHAQGDICVLADNDEVFESELFHIIEKGYQQFPQADIIVFNLNNRPHKLGSQARRLGKWDLLHVGSWQITFRINSIRNNVFFDTKLGAGTGNGAGEENKFLLDCHKKGLKIYYVPSIIATTIETETPSTWFFGREEQFFYNRGKSTRYILGFWVSFLYGIYFILFKWKAGQKGLTRWKAFKALCKGIWKNELKERF